MKLTFIFMKINSQLKFSPGGVGDRAKVKPLPTSVGGSSHYSLLEISGRWRGWLEDSLEVQCDVSLRLAG